MTLAGKARTALRRAATAVDQDEPPKPSARPLRVEQALDGLDEPLVFGFGIHGAFYRLPLFRWWCDRLHDQPRYHRELGEWVYISQTLSERGKLAPACAASALGVGKEPLAALFEPGRGDRRRSRRWSREGRARRGLLGSAQHAGAQLEFVEPARRSAIRTRYRGTEYAVVHEHRRDPRRSRWLRLLLVELRVRAPWQPGAERLVAPFAAGAEARRARSTPPSRPSSNNARVT